MDNLKKLLHREEEADSVISTLSGHCITGGD